MSAQETIQELLRRGREGLGEIDPQEWRCVKARCAWVERMGEALLAAQRKMDDRCSAIVDEVSEEEFQRIFDEEQAKVDVYRVPLFTAAQRDVWPKELYWGGL
jgi:hypothetical protein